MALAPLIILVCLTLILPTLHVCLLPQHHGHVSTSALFFILVLFRARESHLLCYDSRDCDMKNSAVLIAAPQ